MIVKESLKSLVNKSTLIKGIRQQQKKGELDAALQLALQLKAHHCDSWEGFFYHSRILMVQKKYAEARVILNDGLRLFPVQLDLLLELGDCQRKLKDIHGALSAYDLAIENHPYSWKGYVSKADIYMRVNQLDNAKKVIEKGRLTCPRQMNILKAASSTYRMLGLHQDSLEVSLLFTIYHPTSPVGYLRSSQDLVKLGRLSEAKSILTQGASILPHKTESFLSAYLVILDILQDAGDYQGMLAESDYLVNNFHSYWHGHVARIRALALTNQLEDALARLEECNLLFPSNNHLAQVEGFVFEKMNNGLNCEKSYKRYLQLSSPGSAKKSENIQYSEEMIAASIRPLFDASKSSFYTHLAGVSSFIPPQQPHFNERVASVVFDIFDYFGLEYFVFAGSIVGYIRNHRPPVWVDDIDVLVFHEQNRKIIDNIVPILRKLGLRVREQGAKGGHHILGFQRVTKLAFDKNEQIKVRKFQMDIFLTKENCLGYAKNIKNWGLYSTKNVPVTWIKPASKIALFGRDIPVFRFYEWDINLEYGDVMNNVVISSHAGGGRTFLRLPSVHWRDFQRLFEKEFISKPLPAPASLSVEAISRYQPRQGIVVDDSSAQSFADLCSLIVGTGASEIKLLNSRNLWWIMDIKRLFPSINISVFIGRSEDLLLVLVSRSDVCNVDFVNEDLRGEYQSLLSMVGL